jgi:hypothetical protein
MAVNYLPRGTPIRGLFLRSCRSHDKIGRVIMKRLAAFLSAAIACALALAFISPGCTNPCQELTDLCSKCADLSFRQSCEAIVAKNNGAVCAGQRSSFSLFCTADGQGGGGAGGGAGGSGSCLASEARCLGTCVNLLANATFCGACNTSCRTGELCAGGVCILGPDCPAQLADKNNTGGCTDQSEDPTCCGSGCAKCVSDQVCIDGACGDPKDCSGTVCNGACVEKLNADPLHCGKCGNACKDGQVCSAGACTGSCGSGLTQCCGRCVDVTTDPEHCGGCKASCPEAAGTSGGGAAGGGGGASSSTGAGCPGGFQDCAAQLLLCSPCGCVSSEECTVAKGKVNCSGACVDTKSDPNHCGACGTSCASGLKCSGGNCLDGDCPAGKSECSGSCVELQKDPNHCGSCGTACASGQVCDGGYCRASCTAPKAACHGGCIDSSSDVNHCGACDNPCTLGQVCSGGSCLAACPAGLTSCNGSCVDLTQDFDHCGSCGKTCNDNNVCTSDSCVSGTPGGSCKNYSNAALCSTTDPCEQAACDPIEGCVKTVLSAEAIVAGCSLKNPPPAGWSSADLLNAQTYCLYCDSDKPDDPCQYERRSDDVSCTVDACDPKRLQAPSHTDDDDWCLMNAPACAQPTCNGAKNPADPSGQQLLDPKSDPESGCVQEDSKCAANKLLPKCCLAFAADGNGCSSVDCTN